MIKMKYIKNVETLEELKKAYKKLALKLHPDCGGNEEEMKILNNEYDELFSKLKNTHKKVKLTPKKQQKHPNSLRILLINCSI